MKRARQHKLRCLPAKHRAYHEAGHAVAGYFCGDLCGVDILTVGSRTGMCDSQRGQRNTGHAIIICFAGALAQARLTGETPADVILSAGIEDFQSASDVAEAHCQRMRPHWDEVEWPDNMRPEEIERFKKQNTPSGMLDYYEEQASELVGNYWPAVEAVAAALLEKKRLTGKEAQQIIAGAIEEQCER